MELCNVVVSCYGAVVKGVAKIMSVGYYGLSTVEIQVL